MVVVCVFVCVCVGGAAAGGGESYNFFAQQRNVLFPTDGQPIVSSIPNH